MIILFEINIVFSDYLKPHLALSYTASGSLRSLITILRTIIYVILVSTSNMEVMDFLANGKCK